MSLRVGVIGAGLWAQRAHLPALRQQAGVEIRAIADPDRPRAAQLAREFGIPHAVEDHRAVLGLGVDALAIVAPDDVHHAVATAALEAGLPVLCEKPLARTVAEAADLAERAARRGAVTKLGFVFRYSPALRRLRELVQEGFAGRVHSLAVYSQNAQFMDPAAPLHWKMQRARAGGGVYVEYGSHSLDLARWIVGDVREVCANARTVVAERPGPGGAGPQAVDVDDVCSWLATLGDRVEGVFHASWVSLPQPWGDLAVFGDRGALVWRRRDDAWPFAELLGASAPDPVLRPLPIPRRLTDGLEWATTWRECFMGNLVRQFVAEVRGAPPEGPTFADGYEVQVALDALATSLVERRWVSVPAARRGAGASPPGPGRPGPGAGA